MKRFTALAAVLSLFAVGVLVGGFAVHLFYAKEVHPQFRGPRGAGFFLERLQRELDLTEDQRSRVDEILRQAHDEAEALHRELLPRVREHMEHTRARLREVLTPEQQQKFDELQALHRDRAERFLLGRGHRRRGHPGRHGHPPPGEAP